MNGPSGKNSRCGRMIQNDKFNAQVLQEKVEALQMGEDKDETDGLDMTGRAQKALLSLQALAENPHLSAEDQQNSSS
jgi:hypothetical protein